MVKQVTTLVEDIYNVLDGKQKIPEERAKDLGNRLGDMLVRRLSQGDRAPGLSLSQIGEKCDRKTWYSINLPGKALPLEPHTRLKFLYGDIIEELTLFLAEQAGHTVQGQQDTINVGGIDGHRDAVIDGMLVDVKSANSRGFVKFKTHSLETDDPFGYLSQANLYLKGSENDDFTKIKGEFAFLAVDKELGHIVLDRYRRDRGTDWEAMVKHKREVVQRSVIPVRGYSPVPFGQSGNEKLNTKCKYCQYKEECWPGARKFIYSSGPEYLTKVVVEPRVPEEVKTK